MRWRRTASDLSPVSLPRWYKVRANPTRPAPIARLVNPERRLSGRPSITADLHPRPSSNCASTQTSTCLASSSCSQRSRRCSWPFTSIPRRWFTSSTTTSRPRTRFSASRPLDLEPGASRRARPRSDRRARLWTPSARSSHPVAASTAARARPRTGRRARAALRDAPAQISPPTQRRRATLADKPAPARAELSVYVNSCAHPPKKPRRIDARGPRRRPRRRRRRLARLTTARAAAQPGGDSAAVADARDRASLLPSSATRSPPADSARARARSASSPPRARVPPRRRLRWRRAPSRSVASAPPPSETDRLKRDVASYAVESLRAHSRLMDACAETLGRASNPAELESASTRTRLR